MGVTSLTDILGKCVDRDLLSEYFTLLTIRQCGASRRMDDEPFLSSDVGSPLMVLFDASPC